MLKEVKNIVALVTGGASGIGAATVTELLEEGAKHVTFLDLSEELANVLQTELIKKHGPKKVKFIKCDVTNDDQVSRVYTSLMDEHGSIDLVVNAAGVANETMETYKREIDINFTSVVTSTLKARELMRTDRGGRGGTVINISSVAAFTPMHYVFVYCATKAAVLQFGCVLGMEPYYSKTGVRVMTMCFAGTNTHIFSKIRSIDLQNEFEEFVSKIEKQSPTSAARAVLTAYKQGESASVWFSENDLPAKDITEAYKRACGVYSEYMQFSV